MVCYSGSLLTGTNQTFFLVSQFQVGASKNCRIFYGMKKSSFPFVYLDIPLIKGKSTTAHLPPIEDKIRAPLDSWQGKTISLAGRSHLSVNSMILCSFILL